MPQPKDKDQLNAYKTRPLYVLSTTDPPKTRDTCRVKVKGWKKIFHTNVDQKKAGVAILISEKIDFEIKAMKRDKEGHYIMIKGSIHEEDMSYKYIRTQHRSTTICKANANKYERGN